MLSRCLFPVFPLVPAPLSPIAVHDAALPDPVPCGLHNGLPCDCSGFRERLLADPSFPIKVAIECGIGVVTKITAEKAKRQEHFWCAAPTANHDHSMATPGQCMLVPFSTDFLITEGATSTQSTGIYTVTPAHGPLSLRSYIHSRSRSLRVGWWLLP